MDSLKRTWESLRGRPVFWAALGLVILVVAALAVRSGDDPGEPAGEDAQQAAPPADETERPELPDDEGPPAREREGGGELPARGRFRATDAALARLFDEELGPETTKGERRVVEARCSRDRCRVVYMLDQPGVGKALEDQRPIWKELFSAAGLRQAVLVAKSGPRDARGGGTEIPPPFTTTCTRSATRTTDWDSISAEDLRTVCEVRGDVEEEGD